ncbi:MAG: cupin-like domain-containing protein [Maribacter dokdonensis]|uniref:cupin-like domain-containing protein n=1 Tax=Maribacter dokdonensis TaxID=320912 RepID=UPI0032972564
MKLADIPRVRNITKDDFIINYFKPQKPVVLEQAIADWPAFAKWNLDYMKEVAGDITVPLYDNRPVQHKDGFNEPHAKMKMADYVDLLKKEPTKYRIFLWNILKEVPALQKDYAFPDFGLRLLKGLPMLFFGGRDSYTFMHYDIDLANIFHFHFDGEKEVVLFPQSETKKLYKVPHSLITHESIDFSNPDYQKWPALRHANGFKTTLKHGEVLYMPEGFWHYMKYITPGFSMSLRALARNPKNLGKAFYNILIMRHYDVLMRKLKGQDWIDAKNIRAITDTNKNVEALDEN